MARALPPDRMAQLIRASVQVFIDSGFRRTQMADVADALGVAKGTLYLYVESKEALFNLACRSAARPLAIPGRLPAPTPRPRATLKIIADRLGSALASLPAIDAQTDLATIVAAL